MSDNEKKSMPKSTPGGAEHMRRPLPEWLSVKLDIPSDVWDGGMRIELRGRHTLLVHGCCKILQYTPSEMRFLLQGCVLCITGERLVCHSYLAGAVGVEGRINGMCFSDEA